MAYKVIVVNRNPQTRNAEALGRDLEAALAQLDQQGLKPISILPIAGDDGATIGVVITAGQGAR
jgi:hypothetical protein